MAELANELSMTTPFVKGAIRKYHGAAKKARDLSRGNNVNVNVNV
jgi:hypothetical protein